MKKGKRYNKALALINSDKSYLVKEAVNVIAQFPKAKFDETVEMAMRLGVDPKQSDQMVRGTVSLPHGTGKDVRVIVFAKGEQVKEAQEAGADEVGFEELVKKVEGGWLEFDAVVAAPDTMREVGKLGKVLGPRGLMPSPKAGTVTQDLATAVKELKSGRIEFKIDKTANLHIPLGKHSFQENAIVDNLSAAYHAVLRVKPATVKGVYVKSCYLTTTMGPSIRVDLKDLMTASV